MKIDLQVEHVALANPDFQAVLLGLCQDLSKPNMTRWLSVHEVAHLTYFEALCATLGLPHTEIKFVGPTIMQRGQKFKFIYSGVLTPFKEINLRYTKDTLFAIAKGAVAGGVFLNVLENVPEDQAGNKMDEDIDFSWHYAAAMRQPFKPVDSEGRLLQKAKRVVRGNLRNETFKALVLKRASDLEAEHFPRWSGA